MAHIEMDLDERLHPAESRPATLQTHDSGFPAANKDSFKCFHDQEVIYPVSKNNVQRGSIYSTLQDPPLEQKIVNETKPQVTIKYLTIRGKQFSLQVAKKSSSSVKRQKLMANVKAPR